MCTHYPGVTAGDSAQLRRGAKTARNSTGRDSRPQGDADGPSLAHAS